MTSSPSHQRLAQQRPARLLPAEPFLAEPLWCPDCHGRRDFVPVPCAEGHLDCPDRACVECGAALLLLGELVRDPAPVAAVA